MGNVVRLLIAASLLSIAYGFIRGGGWGGWIIGGICVALGILLFWAIFAGKFK